MRLQIFDFRVVYRSGKQNIADPLSRLSTTIDSASVEHNEDEIWVNAAVNSVAIDISETRDSISGDRSLELVKEALQSGLWDAAPRDLIKEYLPFQNELTLVDGCVVRNSRLVVPQSLRQRFLELSHEGHPGESASISRLRDKVWWPLMDQIREKVKSCRGCLLVSQVSVPEPMTRRLMPTQPWLHLALDFLGPMPSGEYVLALIDYYSRYQELVVMRTVTAAATIAVLDQIFVRLGYPLSITIDNGGQFISSAFQEYIYIAMNEKLNTKIPPHIGRRLMAKWKDKTDRF